jgi:acyl-[acyl carrier protein]--UDP-N-acetylglucosamine O-acyltransferase
MKVIKATSIFNPDMHSKNYIHDSVVFVVEDDNANYIGINIGQNNTIMAGSVIFGASSYRENTIIGNDNYIGTGTTIAADAFIGNNNTLEGSNFLNHHSCILNHTTLEYGATITSYSTVGSWAIIGTLSPLVKDAKPFSKVFGNPAVSKGINTSKNFKNHFSEVETLEIKQYIKDSTYPVSPYIVSILDEFENYSRKKAL